ncbi:hypothetical protein CAPTEDRAFT_93061 [Capitella teleta]|uniref:SH2 domain-containing protein n=1 Tax=Capitella teleta TaxID=283909 RepID=R7V9Q3_CAPTE|nr:hypothetical protein CAPTEDRAFT_93061 [Capitella teleta]|eukprot:ELU15212.1 hypothetical protein CAPTEDRAFT_93061 [Capitella teleta]
MEARALYDYNASEDDELSFKKNDKIKVKKTTTLENDWFKARIGYKTGIVPITYIRLHPHSWYVEEFGRDEANAMLQAKTSIGQDMQPDGAFIIRPSDSEAPFAVSVKVGSAVQHLKIKMSDYASYTIWDDETFKSLNELVEYYRKYSILKSKHLLLTDIKTELVEALYDLPANKPGYLALKRGDIITVIHRRDENWLLGTNNKTAARSRGLVPCNYVGAV